MGELIAGANFSGRSVALRERLKAVAPNAFYIGPHAEAALSGLSSTVGDEIAIYQSPTARAPFAQLDFEAWASRKPPTLSGGEQVLLALYCFSCSPYRAIGIDTALEQLDPANREDTLSYLSREDIDAVLVDNQLDTLDGWHCSTLQGDSVAFACNLPAAIAALPRRTVPRIEVRQLSFAYPGGRTIFRDFDLTLDPGRVYRFSGSNGAGKTTLFKLLAGVLAPQSGTLALDGVPYAPWRTGNRIFALATQNPDHQWCGATLAEDLSRRRAAVRRFGELVMPDDGALAHVAAKLGVPSFEQHLYELPLVARKRLSWLWPLCGTMPWVMLDEPTIGQDAATRAALAKAVGQLATLGYGVVFITHDNAFAAAIDHTPIRLGA